MRRRPYRVVYGVDHLAGQPGETGPPRPYQSFVSRKMMTIFQHNYTGTFKLLTYSIQLLRVSVVNLAQVSSRHTVKE